MSHAFSSTPSRRPAPRLMASVAVLAVSAGLACGGVAAASAAPVPASASIAMSSAPIGYDPESVTAQSGRYASFVAYADGEFDSIQWQISMDDGGSWAAVPDTENYVVDTDGGQTNLSIDVLGYAMNGDRFRARYIDADEITYYTDAATLTVIPTVFVTEEVDTHLGEDATFTATPEEGTTAPDITWQKGVYDEMEDDFVWTDLDTTTSTYTIENPTAADDETYYRVRFVLDEETYYSDFGFLDVDPAPWVSTQPAATTTVEAGTPVTLASHATGTPSPTVQWEYFDDEEEEWYPIDGADSDTFTIASPSLSDSGRYRAVFESDEGYVESDPAQLNVTGEVPGTPTQFTATQLSPAGQDHLGRPGQRRHARHVTGYAVGYGAGRSGDGAEESASAREHTFTGLHSGTYSFSVAAINAAGDGEAAVVDRSACRAPMSPRPRTSPPRVVRRASR